MEIQELGAIGHSGRFCELSGLFVDQNLLFYLPVNGPTAGKLKITDYIHVCFRMER